MDIFKLGARDIFGIVLPGAVLLFVIIYVLWSLPATLGLPALDVSPLKDQGFLLSIVFFVASYLLGYLLRLGTADQVDNESSKCLLEEWRKREENQTLEKYFKQLLDQMKRGEDVAYIPIEFNDWVWRAESFPYPIWYLRRATLNYPYAILKFFSQYKRFMGLASNSPSIAGKRFFGYCKLVISKEDSVLREEINAAEGNTRFLAGTYSALRLSFWVLLIPLALQLIAMAVLYISGFSVADLKQSHLMPLVVYTLLLILGSHAARIHIKKHFRRLRLREADTVYDAFYLVCKKKGHDARSSCNLDTPRSMFPEDG